MALKRQKAGRRRVRQRERVKSALELRIAGKTYEGIGHELGVTKQRAHQLVMEAIAEQQGEIAEDAKKVLELELKRIDAIIEELWEQRGDPRVADTILRAGDRRAKLLGLDAPAKVAPTTPDGSAPLPAHIEIALVPAPTPAAAQAAPDAS